MIELQDIGQWAAIITAVVGAFTYFSSRAKAHSAHRHEIERRVTIVETKLRTNFERQIALLPEIQADVKLLLHRVEELETKVENK